MDYKEKAKEVAKVVFYNAGLQDHPKGEDAIEAALREAAAEAYAVIANRLYADPHQWSKRPCSTCQGITDAIGKDFGCIAYSKSNMGYMAYAKAAALRPAKPTGDDNER